MIGGFTVALPRCLRVGAGGESSLVTCPLKSPGSDQDFLLGSVLESKAGAGEYFKGLRWLFLFFIISHNIFC